MLFVLQNPVVESDQLISDVMRVFDRLYDPNSDRSAVPKSLETIRDRLGSRAMPAASVG